MLLNDLVYWYQKKIGTYDKQQWEKTVEQRIFGGFTNVPMRNAKLKTELIDVDLVRGSSFPKAKPKHGLTTVAWLATRRLLFLPLYHCWWIRQTSPRIFALFLLLYGSQFFLMCTYFSNAEARQPGIVSPAEVLMPVGMMFVLCVVHSQIVSTNSGPATIIGRKRAQVRRSRHERCRSGKLRSRRNFRSANEAKLSHESTNERASSVHRCDVSPSVRFAKKVSIESWSSAVGRLEPELARLLIEEKTSDSPELAIRPINEPSDNVPGRNPANVGIVHQQDDDGFESLNGNVSSDNDRANVRPEESHFENVTRPNDAANSAGFEERRNRPVNVAEYEWNNCDWGGAAAAAVSSEVLAKIEIASDGEGDSRDGSLGKKQSPKVAPRERKRPCESEEEGECEEAAINHLTEATTSATEWMGVTTNSDVCSYSSDLEESDGHSETNFSCADLVEHPFSWELELPPSILLSSSCTSSDRVSCTIWTRRDIKKAELSVLDISSAIIARVESMPEGMDYFYGGFLLSLLLSLVPSMKRLSDGYGTETSNNLTGSTINVSDFTRVTLDTWSEDLWNVIAVAFGATVRERTIVLTLAFEKLALSCLLFFLLGVAERTFKQRLLYAKLFSHLTSSRRARKSDLPHFRLNKVRNIKTWLSVRSYLKRRGPQRSVDVIVSAVFIVTLLLLSFVSLELIKDLESLHSRYNVEALMWSFAFGIYILRFMTLGTKINKKYRNLSVLITEQINLYLQIEQKSHKKEELMVANSVLKLAADLIKELECPFKISGLSANPYLYTITKVVLLSALSGVLSELLGFKLKLHKITIK